ncbi:MAG: glutathione ABC transporter substrate-binding protein GsiB [Cupriavidus sp.]|jgi:glutathione transport system substrate-binding protein|uniref:glutathione ABC transporter substrate-binding protein GsiB n=1 Tax=Cupriavidus pauculus TaxID=82633 RepID=UPI0007813A6B|nr:glutathione ABC transporter substrate-binding protein GsiB [Cupriavidus pauculus]MBU67278.1 glutathione ABC transporter substrate-binding protein GsiB [Cupriavidus sp.]KAB0605380.1 glutathione ABC transporter substrate-binding protein GsiB [Cupriavidus pauculus]MBY4728983.1 glutathione ABC transporter substrate-binding protein GsiB [Cupriavidus pauculus]MCM3605296.1 glutathione ABC transporter substrate-binding protein GsiB [Cupriavidus pauculus]UAK99745.1 glutathione ABC transporter substr
MSKVSFRLMAGAAAVGAVGMLAAAPAFAAKDAVMAVYSTFTTLDPYDANDTLSQAATKSFYQGLFGFDKDLKLVNVLAESYEVSKDGLVYTFKLKKNIKFHDGTTFDATAVKANFDRVTDPANKLKRYTLFNRVAKTEVVDPYTARVTLKEPFSPFINVLAHPSAVMISPTALKKYGKEIAFHPVGTGPFEFVEWKQTDYLKGKKFAGYWKTGYPKIDTITWKPVVDNNTRSAVMQTGEADFAFSIPFEQAAVLKASPKVDMIDSPSIIQRYLSFNTMVKPFNDPKVRQAINYAINKEALTKVAFAGHAVPAEGVVPPGVDYAEKLGPWPYNPAKARELLKEAGYPNGFETTLWSAYNHTTAQKVIQFVQQQLQQVGIKAQVQALEAGQRVERVESVQKPEDAGVRMYYVGWSSSTGESDWALRPLLASESMPPKLLNTAYYKNDQVDADIAGALRTTDRGEKAKLYKDAQERIWKDAPWAFLVTEKILYARSKRLTGAYVMPDGSFNFDEIDIKQ